MNLVGALLFFAFSLSAPIAKAGAELCPKNTVIEKHESDMQAIWLNQCVPTCKKVFKVDTPKATAFFEKNCRQFSEVTNSVTKETLLLAKIASDSLDGLMLSCLPDAIKKTGKDLLALPGLVGHLLASPFRAKAEAPEWKTCAANTACRRAVARNEKEFRDQNADRSYRVSDAEVDRQTASKDFKELFAKAQNDQLQERSDCRHQLQSLRRAQLGDQNRWTMAMQENTYSSLSTSSPRCIAILQLLPPSITDADGAIDDGKCLRHGDDPMSCLTTPEKIALGAACASNETADELQKISADACTEIVQTLIPVPVGSAAKTFKAVRGASVAGETTTGLRVSADNLENASSVIATTLAPTRTLRNPEVNQFINEYRSGVYATEAENKAFIDVGTGAVKTTPGKVSRYSDVENSAMKMLNDTTGDKDLVTSVTNYHKDIFFKNLEELKSKYPELGKYSDFKSAKQRAEIDEAFLSTKEPALLKDLNAVFLKTNKEFALKMNQLKISIPKAGPPETWFKGGYGSDLEKASLAARRARKTDNAGMLNFESPQVRGELTKELGQVEEKRVALTQSEDLAPLMAANKDGVELLKPEVFDLVRKNDSPESLSNALSQRYQRPFTTQDADQLRSYVDGVNEFSPTILVAKRENVDFSKATHGGASADFLGMGSANLHATAEGIAGKTSLDDAIVAARAGEQKVTATFKARMEKFKNVVGGNVVCSGDDCIHVATKPLTDSQKTKMLRELARSPETRQVRVAFIGPNVAPEARMQLSSHGEAIEKDFRKALEGHVSFEKLQRMTFGFDMQTTKLNEGTVNLIVGKSTLTRLSAGEQAEMQKAFAAALEKYNGKGHAYEQGTARTSQIRFVPGGALLGIEPQDSTP